MKANVKPKVDKKYLIIAVPTMDTVPAKFMQNFVDLIVNIPENVEWRLVMPQSSLIYDARNNIVNDILADIDNKDTPTTYDNSYTFWLDSDMVIDPRTLGILLDEMDKTPDCEILSALYFGRRAPYNPVCYDGVKLTQDDNQPQIVHVSDEKINARTQTIVRGVGFGCCLVKNSAYKKIRDVMKTGLFFSPILGFGEDLSFCIRAMKSGLNIYCDTGIEAGHLIAYTVAASSSSIRQLRDIGRPPVKPMDEVHENEEKNLEEMLKKDQE